jgi:VWFA-related protein
MRWMKSSKNIAKRASPRRRLTLALPLLLLAAVANSQETTLHTQSTVVLVPALVKTADGGIVYGLDAKDFTIEDNGIEQPARMDETPDSQMVSIVVAIQIGRRANYEFPRIKGLPAMLEPIVSQGHAQVSVVEFDSEVHPVHDFSSNPNRLIQDVNDLQPGDGGAAILDAVDFSLKLLEKVPKQRQRILLLISETRDHGSHSAKVDDVVAEIGQSNTAVYALAFSPSLSNILDTGRGTNKDEMHNGVDFLGLLNQARQAVRKNVPDAIASMTGGEYELFATGKKFDERVNDFTNHLHSRYLLSIEPKNPSPGLHQIRVRLRNPGSSTVLARTSYWAAGQ